MQPVRLANEALPQTRLILVTRPVYSLSIRVAATRSSVADRIKPLQAIGFQD
jgi:hypothetical protein